MKKELLSILLLTTITQCTGQFSPTAEYITKNKGNWTIEIPEVQELFHIIVALTPVGKEDFNMVQHNTAYYAKVMNRFRKYENHALVNRMNKLLESQRYVFLKMDACGFYFNEKNKIEKDRMYKQLNWHDQNHIEPLISDLEDFAITTGFRDFFRSNKNYYDEQIETMKSQMPIDKQWKWLEERFPNKYDHYRITFSPLVNGTHSTNRFETRDFRQTMMFICGPVEYEEWSEKLKEGMMTKVVFTEIDHNYINPVSDNFRSEIDEVFDDRGKWTSGKDSEHYKSAYAVFNEYMTWAVFSLYAMDNFNETDFKAINERVESQMKDRRGFSKFAEFNQELIALYRNKKAGQTIVDLYPPILSWCKNSDQLPATGNR